MRSGAALFVLSCLQILSYELYGQYNAKGRVFDGETGEPLAGVYVIFGKDTGTSTNDQGAYSFSTDASRVTVSFQFIGFKTVVREFTLAAGD
ncbi:MAG: carboxypeptidase-like regulatory domain-containing protein, partial [Bacteroidales bacterium]|nr:carboxypeptidase-like regulatory domain-containing protein [Bacteroidales bacterium]